MHDVAFILAGLAVGVVVGLSGVGGGSLMTPLLIFFLGVPPALAVGTDLLFAACTKAGGVGRLARAGLVPWRIVAQLSAGSLPAALLTLLWLRRLGPTQAVAQGLITTTLGIALLLTALATLYKALRGAPRGVLPAPAPAAARPRHGSLPLLLGALLGVLVTLTSVGAGAIGLSVLLLIYPQLPLSRAVAADLGYAVPLTLVAGLGHAALGAVDWTLLAKLLAGSLPGIWLGSRLLHRVSERVSRTGVSLLLAWAGLRLITL